MLAGHATRQHGSDFLNSLLIYLYSPATLTFLVALTRRHSCLAHTPTYRKARFKSYQPKYHTHTPTKHKHKQISKINNNQITKLMTLTMLEMTTTSLQPMLIHADNTTDITADNNDDKMLLLTPMPMTTTPIQQW